MATETRVNPGKVELRSGDSRTMFGYAAVFGKLSQNLGGFVERVEPTAFNRTLDSSDVLALVNHEANQVLGRSSAGTLRLNVDSIGLRYEIDPPNTTYARDLIESMQRGDIKSSSFSFLTIDEEWATTNNDFPLRKLKEVKLVDVSVVTFPAYPDAVSGIRNLALEKLAKRSGVSVESLRDAAAIKRTMNSPGLWDRRRKFVADLQRIY